MVWNTRQAANRKYKTAYKYPQVKFFYFLTILLLFFQASAQEPPCGVILFGSEVNPNLYPASFIENLMNPASPCVFASNPTYGQNAITLDQPDLVPCAGDTLSGIWVQAPNHEPLCVYTFPPGAISIPGTDFLGSLVIGDQSFFIAIVGVPIGVGALDNFVSTGYIPVNPTYNDTLEVITCDPDSAGFVFTENLQTDCGCDSTVTKVYVYEELSANIAGPDFICFGDTVALSAVPNISGSLDYSWSTGDSAQSIAISEEGLYEVTITSSSGCYFTTSRLIGFYPLNDLEIEGPQNVCIGNNFQLRENSSYHSYVWTLPDSSTVAGSQISFAANESHEGIYTLRAIDSYGCELLELTYLLVEFPVALPEFPDIEACNGDTLSISFAQALEDQSTFYEWVNGRGHSYELNRPWFVKRNWRGTNRIVATTAGGCVSETAFHLEINRCKTDCDSIPIFFPNIITPNYDGANDKFIIEGNCEEILISRLLIFNRWGGLVYERRDFCPGDAGAGWDGTQQGKIVESGVYAYLAWATDLVTGKECRFEGAITVLSKK
jgi:gliding motility-associated-like protein